MWRKYGSGVEMVNWLRFFHDPRKWDYLVVAKCRCRHNMKKVWRRISVINIYLTVEVSRNETYGLFDVIVTNGSHFLCSFWKMVREIRESIKQAELFVRKVKVRHSENNQIDLLCSAAVREKKYREPPPRRFRASGNLARQWCNSLFHRTSRKITDSQLRTISIATSARIIQSHQSNH